MCLFPIPVKSASKCYEKLVQKEIISSHKTITGRLAESILFIIVITFFFKFFIKSDATTGCSQDWGYAKSRLGAKYSYAVELPDDDYYGFFLPESKIQRTGIETFAAVKEMGKRVVTEYCDL